MRKTPASIRAVTDPHGPWVARLRTELTPERFHHTMCVARWAEALARRHGADPGRARLAALIHDSVKNLSGARLAGYVRRHGLRVPGDEFIRRTGLYDLYHAPVAAHRAKRKFGVRDAAVLRAAARHTLGARRMGRLDKILFVADFSSPDRRFAQARRVRRLARQDLEAAFIETLRWKMIFVLKSGGALHRETVQLWNHAEKRKGAV